MKPGLNKDHLDPAYQFGRLMALFGYIQKKAHEKEVLAGVVERWYTGVAAAPGLYLGKLTSLSNFHLAKIRKTQP